MRFLLTLLIFIPISLFSQAVGDWSSFPSHSRVRFLSEAENSIWAASDGGLFEFNLESEILTSITPLDGMHQSAVSAMISDPEKQHLWLGFPNGTVQRFNLDTRLFSTVVDINRASQFTQRSINAFEIDDNFLFIATGFGVVKLDRNRLIVLDTFFNLGSENSSSPVFDVALRGDSLYAGTSSGIAVGNTNNELIVPQNWRNIASPNNAAVTQLTWFADTLNIVSAQKHWKFRDSWAEIASSSPASDPVVSMDSHNGFLIVASSFRYSIYDRNQLRFSVGINGGPTTRGLSTASHFWLGTSERGVSRFSVSSSEIDDQILPNGPALNAFTGIAAQDGKLVVASSNSPGGSRGFGITGYYIFRDNEWDIFDIRNSQMVADQSFNSVFSVSIGKNKALLGSWGVGLGIHDFSTDELTVYNATNSPLQGIATSPNFVVLTSAFEDNSGAIWTTSLFAEDSPLFRFNPTSDEWTAFPYAPTVPFNANYLKVISDSFNQLWIVVGGASVQGTGILVYDPKNISDPDDDESVYLTGINANLPNNDVNDIVEDNKGEIWIATSRGVARFLFPELIVVGGQQERQAQWLITENEDGNRVFFLRDINATSLAVNAANQKWIGSEGNGVWLVTESGDRAVEHFTAENSPLISNNVLDVAVDDETGTVFFATDLGLISFTSVAKQDAPELEKLFVYPNPYSYSKENGPVYIEGLRGETTISILSVDGTIVDRIVGRGGRIEWQPKRADGGKLPTGVYILSATEDGKNRAFGKLIVTP